MKTKTQISTLNKLKSLALVGLLTVAGAGAAPAQNLLVNGDFTANASLFTQFPGYVQQWSAANPVDITGWTHTFLSGINGAGTVTGVFGPVNDGGRTYAFLQSGGALIQSLSGSYTPNTTYQLNFDVARRAGDTSLSYRVQIGDNTQIHFTTQVGGNDVLIANQAQFDTLSYTFTSPAAFVGVPSIQLYHLTGGGVTLDFANMSLTQVPEPTTAALAGLGTVLVGAGWRLRRRTA